MARKAEIGVSRARGLRLGLAAVGVALCAGAFALSGLRADSTLPVKPGGLAAAPSEPAVPQAGAPAEAEGVKLSPLCEAPSADIAAPAPLPRMAQALAAKQPLRILAIGSSSTFGLGASSRRRNYPNQLTDILEQSLKGVDVETINRGVSGEVAATTAERMRSEVALERPDVVLWQVGTNDALSRVPPQDFERTVLSTVRWLKESGIDVVLVGLQYAPRFAQDENYRDIRAVMQNIAAQENVLYIRRYDAMQFIARARKTTNMISPDELHLNDQGYRCMAEHIAQAVIANLFLRRVRPNNHPQGGP